MNAPLSPAEVFALAPVEKIPAGDAVLALRRFGEGPPLLLIHGWPVHGFTWRKLLPALSQRFTCYVVDLVGAGDSEWSAHTDFNFHAHARRLRLLIDQLGLERYSVLAHDTGGTVARCLGLIDGARMEKLAIINTEMPGHRPPWVPLYQKLLRLPGMQWVFRQQLRSRMFVRSSMGFGVLFCDLNLLEGEFREQFVTRYISSARATDGLVRYLIGIPWDVVDAFAQRHAELRMPVLLIWGENDPTFPIHLAREMAKQFPNCRGLVSIPGTRLLPHEETPEAVARAALDFLDA